MALVLALLLALCSACGRVPSAASAAPAPAVQAAPAPVAETPAATQVDFRSQVQPILEARCMPCHFEGGKMYEELPFDRPETIHKLGTHLFTRIKDENEQAILRSFRSQGPPATAPLTSGS